MDRLAASRFRFCASHRAPRQNHAEYLSDALLQRFTQRMPPAATGVPAAFAALHNESYRSA
jgi:hypothetical protein